MKRLFLMVVAVLSMTTVFGENENVNKVQSYDMNVNMSSLSSYLGLSLDQKEFVADTHKTFCADMMNAANAKADERAGLVDQAVVRDLKYMRAILTENQYRKYVTVLNMTFVNRGLMK
jgi:hypothetical protein